MGLGSWVVGRRSPTVRRLLELGVTISGVDNKYELFYQAEAVKLEDILKRALRSGPPVRHAAPVVSSVKPIGQSSNSVRSG